MNKKMKEMLKDAWVEAKWKNGFTWTKEKYSNLSEFIDLNNVKISTDRRHGAGHFVVKLVTGQQTIKVFCTFCEIERTLYNLIAQHCIYLGDRTKIKTRFKCWDI